jgi:membrane-associated phospholipid phosphatase
MTWHAAGLRRLDGIIWAIIAAVAGLILASPLLSNFQLVWHSFLAAACTTAICLAGTWFYQARRPDSKLAAALGGTAQIVAFAAVGAPLSYIAASLDLPLQDHWFDLADRALGLDWSALLAWMDAHAALHPLFRTIYWSLMPQTVVVVLALALAGRLAWLRIFMLAFLISTLVTIAVATIFPAEGVWGFYRLHGTDYPDIAPATQQLHLAVFHGLRHGTFRQLMATGAEGIITFPSLHAALALLLAAGLWPIPLLRWVGLALNAVMLLSIPIDGGHYFIDVAAGLAIAWGSLAVAKVAAARAHQPLESFAAADIGLVPGE